MAQKPEMRRAYAQQKLFVILLVLWPPFTGRSSALYFFLLLILLFFAFYCCYFYLILFSLLLFVVISSYEAIFCFIILLFFKLGHQLCVTTWPSLVLLNLVCSRPSCHPFASSWSQSFEQSLPFLGLWSRSPFSFLSPVVSRRRNSDVVVRICCQNEFLGVSPSFRVHFYHTQSHWCNCWLFRNLKVKIRLKINLLFMKKGRHDLLPNVRTVVPRFLSPVK